MNRSNKLLVVGVVILIALFCALLSVSGLLVGYFATAATASNSTNESGLTQQEMESAVLSIAADYTVTRDLPAAQQSLATLGIPNEAQYVSFMVDRYIQEGRDSADVDTQNLFNLATALGASTVSMVQALSTPSPTSSPTVPPTATPIPPTITSVPPPTEIPPTETPLPLPTDTPVAATDTPTVVPPTNTPAPPTNTPEPTATPEPTKPAVDYRVAEANMVPNPSYNSCPGAHQIFVTVLDAGGNPLDGVTVVDTFGAVPPHISGDKGPGKLEYDLWNNGFSLRVEKNPDGSPVSSEETPKLSSWDEDIPDEWLVEANYCKDLSDCAARKANNQLCRGHYSYNVVFQKTY
jgi:hypothetical protein